MDKSSIVQNDETRFCGADNAPYSHSSLLGDLQLPKSQGVPLNNGNTEPKPHVLCLNHHHKFDAFLKRRKLLKEISSKMKIHLLKEVLSKK
jgi:hypothetical protein